MFKCFKLIFYKIVLFSRTQHIRTILIFFEYKQHNIVRCVRFTLDELIKLILSCFSRFISKTKWVEYIFFNLINYVFNNFSSTYFPCAHITTIQSFWLRPSMVWEYIFSNVKYLVSNVYHILPNILMCGRMVDILQIWKQYCLNRR